MKNFTQSRWNETLACQKWERIGETECVDEMATQFSSMINNALNEIAPMKSFTNMRQLEIIDTAAK